MEVSDQHKSTTNENEQSDSRELNASLTSISRGATLFVCGKGIDNVLRFGINVVLTRGLGEALFGVYTYGYLVLSLLSTVTNLGTDTAILKYLSQYEGQHMQQNRILGLSFLTSLLGSVAIGSALFLGAPFISGHTLDDPLLTNVLRILAIVIPFNALGNCILTTFKAMERPEYQVFVLNVLSPLLRFLLIAIALLLGSELIGVIASSVAAAILVFFVSASLFLTRTSFRPTVRGTSDYVVEFYNYSLPLTLTQAGSILANRIDVLMVGIFIQQSTAVGVYKVSLIIAGMLVLPLSAFNQIFPPIASRLHSNGKKEELESIYRLLTRWIFTVALFFFLCTVIYSDSILRIFGDGYVSGSTILILFTVGQLANAAVGPSGYLLMMTDHQYLTLINRWGLGILNVICNYFFIQKFGLAGAALATASVLGLINVARVVEVWYTEQLFPYSWGFSKPIIAAAGAGAVMYGLRDVLSSYGLLLGGSAVGFCIFAGILFLLGIETEDREFFSTVTSRL